MFRFIDTRIVFNRFGKSLSNKRLMSSDIILGAIANALSPNKPSIECKSTKDELTKNSSVTANTLFDIRSYPNSKTNTIFNVCPQGYKMVIETLGRFSSIKESGWFISIPLIQEIKYVVDDREMVIDVYKQFAHTLDNVQIGIAAQLYLRFTDVYKACYNIKQPLVAIVAHAQSAMRTSVGKYDLDHLLKDRASINRDVDNVLSKSAEQWGIKINRVEITELTPDNNIAKAMDLQATAERERRRTEKDADAKKRAMELESEGYKLKLINEATGKSESILVEATALAKVINVLKESGIQPKDTLQLQIIQQYLSNLSIMANSGKHTTFFVGKDISNIKNMTANILDVLNKH